MKKIIMIVFALFMALSVTYSLAEDGLSPEMTGQPTVSSIPEPTPDQSEDYALLERLRAFFGCWAASNQEDMLALCAPTWAAGTEKPETALSVLLQDRTPKSYAEISITGTAEAESRTVTIISAMDKHDGTASVKYIINIAMVKEADGLWYVEPESILSSVEYSPETYSTNAPEQTAVPVIDNGDSSSLSPVVDDPVLSLFPGFSWAMTQQDMYDKYGYDYFSDIERSEIAMAAIKDIMGEETIIHFFFSKEKLHSISILDIGDRLEQFVEIYTTLYGKPIRASAIDVMIGDYSESTESDCCVWETDCAYIVIQDSASSIQYKPLD